MELDARILEIEFPIEFVVPGTPVSCQGVAQLKWRDRIKAASLNALPEGHFCSDEQVAVSLLYFPTGKMQGDIDNIVKPFLDALNKHILFDDRQVARVWAQRLDPLITHLKFKNPWPGLVAALLTPRPFTYVRISNDLFEGMPL